MAEVELPNPEELHERGEDRFGRRVALVTAVFAVILSISSLGANNATKEMLLAQQKSSDQWAFYRLLLATAGATLTLIGYFLFFQLPWLQEGTEDGGRAAPPGGRRSHEVAPRSHSSTRAAKNACSRRFLVR